MADIGILSATVSANPQPFVGGLRQAQAALSTFADTAKTHLGKFSSSATSALSGLAGSGIASQISGTFGSLLSGGLSLATAAMTGPAGIAVAALAATAALGSLGQAGIAQIGTTTRMARQLGVSVFEMHALSQAAEDSGIAIGDQIGVFSQMLRRTGSLRQDLATAGASTATASTAVVGLGTGTAPSGMQRALGELGISASTFAGARVTDQLRMIARGMETVTNASDRQRISFELFGRRGQAMMGLVGRGLSEFESRVSSGDFLRELISDNDLANMQAAAKAMKELGFTFKDIGDKVKIVAGAMIAPIVVGLNTMIGEFAKFIESIVAVGASIASLIPTAGIMIVLAAIRAYWSAVATYLNGIAIIAQAVRAGFQDIRNTVAPLFTAIGNIFTRMNAGGTIVAVITGAFRVLAAIVRVGFAAVAVVTEWVVNGLARIGAIAFLVGAQISDALGPTVAVVIEQLRGVFLSLRLAWASIVQAFQGGGLDINRLMEIIGTVATSVIGGVFYGALLMVIGAVRNLGLFIQGIAIIAGFAIGVVVDQFALIGTVAGMVFRSMASNVQFVIDLFTLLIDAVQGYIGALTSIPSLSSIPGYSTLFGSSTADSSTSAAPASPTAGLSATLREMAASLFNFRNTPAATPGPGSAATPGSLNQEIGARAATLDSVDAVTAIIQSQFAPRADPVVAAVSEVVTSTTGTTSAVDNLAARIEALLGSLGVPAALGGA